ncbi:uncharacterized protein LOC131293595 [Anopheles ziemanni]|uniref:uncharacterized protein LOC131264409 n=1 Tax=Anopheles coustani TaxID=139045 RepID=UPI002658CAE6|nr:uncharacterized protein LOC131264409 [Anopheles coustani]XP_058177657.1 uncharacterized protein LOC131293595 [Anopheles ziemanni]
MVRSCSQVRFRTALERLSISLNLTDFVNLVQGMVSNNAAQAQEQLNGEDLPDVPPVVNDKAADGSLLDDYVNCPPDDANDGAQGEPTLPDSDKGPTNVIRTKFDDYPPLIKVRDDRVLKAGIGMRPGPFDEPKIIYDQQDIELLDVTDSVTLDDVRRVFVNVADDNIEGSGGDEPQKEPEVVTETREEILIHVSQQKPLRIVDSKQALEESDVEEQGPLKHLDAKTLYDLLEGETREQGVRKYFENHPDEIILSSPEYPNPYPLEWNEMKNFSVDGGRGVQITIHDLDLNPTTDFLYIRAGNIEDVEEKGPVLTGTYTEPIRFLIPQTTYFTIHFVAQQDPDGEQKHRGFQLSYAPFGEMVSPTTPTTTEIIVPQEELQWTTKEIVMTPTMMELQSTWSEIKEALSNASNMYIESRNLSYMPSRPFDVKLLARKCPDTWRNHENCVSLEFAVPLRPILYEPSYDDDGLDMGFGNKFLQKGFISIVTTEATEPQYELDVAHLDEMWNEFGQMAVQRAGYDGYIMPESGRILLTWIGISLAIVGTFLFVLYMIWKIDIFKDYRRISRTSHAVAPDDDKNELKKKEFDISMFPSPHQVVPTFFPTGEPYGPDAEAQYAYDNTTMSQWPEDFSEPKYPETSFGGGPPQRTSQQRTTGLARPYEPVSPMDLSTAPMDFNDSPRMPRSSAGNRGNPFLSPPGGGPRTSTGNPPPGLR